MNAEEAIMSEQENLQLVRQGYAAFQRGDIEGVLQTFADDIEWTIPGPADIPLNGRRQGRGEVAEFFKLLAETEEAQVFEPQRFVAGEELVIVLGHYRWLIKANGRIAEADWVHVFTCRDGKVAKFQEYSDTAAFAAAYRAAPVAAV
jgi:ketosteroid isomerase-like protein